MATKKVTEVDTLQTISADANLYVEDGGGFRRTSLDAVKDHITADCVTGDLDSSADSGTPILVNADTLGGRITAAVVDSKANQSDVSALNSAVTTIDSKRVNTSTYDANTDRTVEQNRFNAIKYYMENYAPTYGFCAFTIRYYGGYAINYIAFRYSTIYLIYEFSVYDGGSIMAYVYNTSSKEISKQFTK